MKHIQVRRWPPGSPAAGVTAEYFSSEDNMSVNRRDGLIEILDGNIVRAVFANMPIEVTNAETGEEVPKPGN